MYLDYVDLAFHQGKLYALSRLDTLFDIEVSVGHSTGDPYGFLKCDGSSRIHLSLHPIPLLL
jgi:hypothetical protein